jgi:F420-dependent oxidoreductase-like protein
MRIGVMMDDRAIGSDLDRLIDEIRDLDRRGFATAWVPNTFTFDAMGALTVVGRETERIEVGTAVVPTFTRHPFTMAQQALTAQAACRGRFTLGIGLSHQIVIESLFGLSYDRPARHMREYLDVLVPLLEGGPASHQGEVFRVNARLGMTGVPRVPVLLAALGPRMLALAGGLSEGTITWMTGPKTIESHVAPVIREAAKEAGRPDPRIVCGTPIAITTRPDEARDAASSYFRMYRDLPSYRAMLDREGAAEPGDIAIVGDETEVRTGLSRLESSGVTDLDAAVFVADEGSVERTLDFLAGEL